MKKSLNKKRRRRSIIAFEMIRLDRSSVEPIHQQLYRQIRDELASGSFNQNSSRLPSSRALAADLGIARLTVKLAFEELHSEGYLQARVGSGTFVADFLPEIFLSPGKPDTETAKRTPGASFRAGEESAGHTCRETVRTSGSPERPASLLFPRSRRSTNFP